MVNLVSLIQEYNGENVWEVQTKKLCDLWESHFWGKQRMCNIFYLFKVWWTLWVSFKTKTKNMFEKLNLKNFVTFVSLTFGANRKCVTFVTCLKFDEPWESHSRQKWEHVWGTKTLKFYDLLCESHLMHLVGLIKHYK